MTIDISQETCLTVTVIICVFATHEEGLFHENSFIDTKLIDDKFHKVTIHTTNSNEVITFLQDFPEILNAPNLLKLTLDA